MPRASNDKMPVQRRGLLANPIVQIADYALTGGLLGAFQDRNTRAGMFRDQQSILGGMPTPDLFEPPQYAPPTNDAGRALPDPLSDVPYATRFGTWARDYARAGGDISDATALYGQIKPQVSVDTESGFQTAQDGRVVGQLPRTEYIDGYKVNPYAKDAPGYLPKLPQGTIPDGRGGVIPIPGAIQAEAGRAGSITAAEAFAKAPTEFITVKGPNGEDITMPKPMAMGRSFAGQTPAAAAAAKIGAEAGATASVDLPKQYGSAFEAKKLIGELRVHEALGARTGLSGVLPALPGSKGRGFDASLAQLKGKVFLQAYAELKGTGTITEIEGQKAEAAVARLDRAQSQEDFIKALSDLESIIDAGLKRAEAKAAPTAGASPAGGVSRDAAIAELKRRGKWPPR